MADQDPAAPGSSSTAPRLAHDLRAIREERGISLDDMQRETRMPSDILKRLEAGDLIGDPHYNEVYLRNLLKSYAQALAISPQEVMAAYEQAKSGAYNGALRTRYIDGDASAAPVAPKEPAERDPKPVAAEPPAEAKTPPPAKGGTAPAVAALSKPPKPKKEEEEKPKASSAESMPKRRVAAPGAASQPLEKSWAMIIAGTVVALLVIGGILWFLFRDTSPDPEPIAAEPAPADTAQTEPADDPEPEPDAPPPTSAPSFQRPIQLTVAAGDEPLENFRVQVDDDARRPYWIEPGQTESFTAQREIRVWGEVQQGATGGGDYDGARLRLQGLEWAPQDGRIVVIDADRGQAVLDSLARAGANRIGASG